MRSRLFAHAAAHDVVLGAQGTHPWADYREQPNIDTEHYRRVVDGLQYVARRNNTFSLHVHVGVQGADRAVRTCDRLRPVLPILLAVSANSPFLEGRDSGLHSVRTQTFTKSFPRCGIPDAYGDWATYRAYLELLVATGSIVESTQVWWSVRPHLAFGTVEVRICDAQETAGESEALAELIVACVLQAARDVAEGVPFRDPERRLVEENLWRAIRWGRDGRMIDLERLEEQPTAAAIDALLAWTAPVRAELGVDPDLTGPGGAQRQRALLQRRRHAARGLRRLRRGHDPHVRPSNRPRGVHAMTDQPMTPGPDGPPPTEEELRAAYEAELAQLRIEEVLIQTVVSLLNLGARKAGLVPGSEGERDLEQVRKAIDGARALLPVIEPDLGPNAGPLRDALSQLQLAYTQLAGAGEAAPDARGGRARTGIRGARRRGTRARAELRAPLGSRAVDPHTSFRDRSRYHPRRFWPGRTSACAPFRAA